MSSSIGKSFQLNLSWFLCQFAEYLSFDYFVKHTHTHSVHIHEKILVFVVIICTDETVVSTGLMVITLANILKSTSILSPTDRYNSLMGVQISCQVLDFPLSSVTRIVLGRWNYYCPHTVLHSFSGELTAPLSLHFRVTFQQNNWHWDHGHWNTAQLL